MSWIYILCAVMLILSAYTNFAEWFYNRLRYIVGLAILTVALIIDLAEWVVKFLLGVIALSGRALLIIMGFLLVHFRLRRVEKC